MDYRGLGSGIIRALKADADIEFRNESSGDQFRAILWRTTQKTEQKTESDLKSSLKTENEKKTTQKTTQKILNIMKDNPYASIEEIAETCGLTRDGVNWQIRKLKESGKIRRVGPDKGGHWEVCE